MRDLLLAVGVFVVITTTATVAGAANLGTAATFGQLAFVVALVALMARPSGGE